MSQVNLTRFDLEEQIMRCWNVVEDVNEVYAAVMERDLSQDDIANALLGIKTLYDMKFYTLFSTFEKMIKENHEENSNQ